MLRCAVCDDDAAALEKISGILREFCAAHPEAPLQAEYYSSSRKLCDEVAAGKLFDIFLLDVEMPEPDGFAAASLIRDHLAPAAILFLTSHTEFPVVRESFKVEALRYVSKLNMEEALPEALSAALMFCRKKEGEYLTLTWYSNAVRVPVEEIRLLRKTGRTTEISAGEQTLYDSRGLSQLLEAIGDERFLLIGKSTAVNLAHVLSVSGSQLTLKSGEVLPVGRKMLPGVKRAILQIWGKTR